MPDPKDDNTSTNLPSPEPLATAELSSLPIAAGAEPVEDGTDDLIAVLNALSPADMNMELILDHLTTSNDLFSSPHLDLSSLPNGEDHQA